MEVKIDAIAIFCVPINTLTLKVIVMTNDALWHFLKQDNYSTVGGEGM